MVRISGTLIAFVLIAGTMIYGAGFYNGATYVHKKRSGINREGSPYTAIIKLDNTIDSVILYADPSQSKSTVEDNIEKFRRIYRDSSTMLFVYPTEVADFPGCN